jgi:hypothetical protein
VFLKELSHEIFTFFGIEWIYVGLNRSSFWFFSFKEILSILDSQFKYGCVSYLTFLEIVQISEKD